MAKTTLNDLDWLKNKEDPKVIEFLNLHNTVCEKYFAPLEPTINKICEEMLSLVETVESSVPFRMGSYDYYYVQNKDDSYKTWFRIDPKTGVCQDILDGNTLSKDLPYFSIGDWQISPNESMIAYTVDTRGDEYYDVYVKNLNEHTPPIRIASNCDAHIIWHGDNHHIYTLNFDDTHRPYQVCRISILANEAPKVLWEETDPIFHVSLYGSKNEQTCFIHSHSKSTSEIHAIDLHDPSFKVFCIQSRVPGVLYEVEDLGHEWVKITSEDQCINGKVQTISKKDLSQGLPWITRVAHDLERRISDIDVFKNHWVLHERYKGLTHFRIIHSLTYVAQDVIFPEAAYYVEEDHNEDFNATHFRFSYESPIRPETVYEIDFESLSLTVLKSPSLPRTIMPADYHLEYVRVPGHDGTQVPLTLFYKKEGFKLHHNPALLVGYGAYEISREPYFQRSYMSLLDRGFVVAIAHIRGGGELGRKWYEDGKLLHKKNTFNDFINCALFLKQQGYCKSHGLGIMGGSAGGLLMGAVLNMEPSLFDAVVAVVPFVDVYSTMLDETLPLTVTEFEEWGNPKDPVFGPYILSYSPVDNLGEYAYPAILATAGLHDPRVSYWEPAKWIKRISELRTNQNTLLLKTDMTSGHGGPSARLEQFREQAKLIAFLIQELKVASR